MIIKEAIGIQCSLQLSPIAKALHFAMQNGVPHVWLDTHYHWNVSDITNLTVITVNFRILPTGANSPLAWFHIGTCFDGPFVWHLYADHKLDGGV